MLDRPYLVIDWKVADDRAVNLAKGMVVEAKRNGGRYSHKLIWFWKAAKDAGWDEDEAAFWILSGDWHDVEHGSDLRNVF